ncbi:hypothetical protein Aduo_007845 [Ancylostoma duodenale]
MCYTIPPAILLILLPTVTSLPAPLKCVVMTSRAEIRTISAVDRARLLTEYKRQRRALGPLQFTKALATAQLCDIVKRIDKALAPQRMPYWDVRWDLRLPRPGDSVIFSENFFTKMRRRRAKQNFPKEAVPRGLNSLFRRLSVNDSLTSAIRASRAAQLLIMLYQLGQWKEGEDNCSTCSRRSPMAFCDQREQQCVSRITMTSSCSGFPDVDPCYASKCVEGVCVPLVETAASESPEAPKKKIAERAVPMTTSTTTTTTSTPATDIVARLLDVADEEQLSDSDNSTLVQSNSTDISDSSAVELVTDDQNSTNSGEEEAKTAIQRLPQPTYASATTATTPGSTLAPPTSFRFDNPHFNRDLLTWVYSFDDFLPYPTVYFSVMVVAGKYKPRPRPQRNAAGVTVFSRGENLPNGYTHIVEALPLDSGHVIRIPDPAATDVLVEFSLIVRKNGQDCARLCLYRRRYVPCKRTTVRLSKYPALTDHVHYYKTPRQVINRLWKGAGYFRRRTQDAFIFTCPTGL